MENSMKEHIKNIEELINEIADTMFWFLWWFESKRGGYYKFKYIKNEFKGE